MRSAGVKVVILTTFETDEYVYQALRAGASGFLVKDAEPEELIRAVRVVAPGRGAALAERDPPPDRLARQPRPGRPPRRRARPPRSGQPRRCPAADLARLTEREREVLVLVAQGLSNDEIAGRLYLSPLTTKTHVSHIMTKLARPRPRPAGGHRLRVRPGRARRNHLRRACLLQHQVGERPEPGDQAVDAERVQRLVLAEVLGQEPDGQVGADAGDQRPDEDRAVDARCSAARSGPSP